MLVLMSRQALIYIRYKLTQQPKILLIKPMGY